LVLARRKREGGRKGVEMRKGGWVGWREV